MKIKPNDLESWGSDYNEAIRRADHWAQAAERIVEHGLRPARVDSYDPDHRQQSELAPNIVGFAAVCAQLADTWANIAQAHAADPAREDAGR